MRLLVLLNVYHPDVGGGGTVYTDLFRTLASRGIHVTVRVPYPFYPEWKDKSGRNGLSIWRYEEEGVTVERYGLFIPRNPNSLTQRLLYEASFLASLLRGAFDARRFDAIMAFSPLAGGVAAGVVMKKLAGKPLWLNVQDISAGAAAAAGITRAASAGSMLERIERYLFNQADVWSTISPVMVERLAHLRDRGQRILYLPNWVGLSLQREIENAVHVAQPPGSPLRLLYAGNIGRKQDLLRFCQALARTRTDFRMSVYGSGGGAEEVSRWIEESADTRFRFAAFLPERDFANELVNSDLYVITETEGVGGSFIPSKLVSGMLAGSPILAVCGEDSPLGRETREAEAGPWLPWNRLGELGAVIEAIDRDRARLNRWAQNGRRRARLYDRIAIIGQFEDELRRLCGGSDETPRRDPIAAAARDVVTTG